MSQRAGSQSVRWSPSSLPSTLCFAWVFFSGIGSFALCRWDYIKHNMLFSYLLEQKLPISVLLDGTNHILHYSVAYYITPVRLYQSLAWLAPDVSLNVILFIMYSAAMFLSFRLLAGRRPVFLLALLAVAGLTGGLDLAGNGRNGGRAGKRSHAIARYPHPLQSRVVGRAVCSAKPDDEPLLCATALLWRVDRHGLALCIAPVRSAIGCQSQSEVVIVIAASVFWSPYVAVGLAVLAVVLLFSLDQQGTLVRRLKQEGFAGLLSLRGLVSGALAIALTLAGGLFLTAAVSLSPPAPYREPSHRASLDAHLRVQLRAAPSCARSRLLVGGLEGGSHGCPGKPRTPSARISNTRGRAWRKRCALARDAWPFQ